MAGAGVAVAAGAAFGAVAAGVAAGAVTGACGTDTVGAALASAGCALIAVCTGGAACAKLQTAIEVTASTGLKSVSNRIAPSMRERGIENQKPQG
jgi:hypothetical protein